MFTKEYNADLCVIGGGMAGICAAISAARRGVKVVLVQDRPVLGGNASSEIRMWIRGVSEKYPYLREGGILEELAMDQIYYNSEMNYPMWDAVLYQKVISEKNIILLLNSTCFKAKSKDDIIQSIQAWQLTTYTLITINADYFADCSGDSILADLIQAKYAVGREAKSEFDESLAQEKSDKKTMGNSCLIQARDIGREVKFIPPTFAKKFDRDSFPYRLNITSKDGFIKDNFWWMEIGGEQDTIKDAEVIKTELLSIAYGVWDFIKNSGIYDSANWNLEWCGYLSGKRESRRYIGNYILTQNDIDNSEIFEDEIAYGGWSMDDHNPKGFMTKEPPNTFHKVSKPYSIPYRCLYSINIKNLFFAGRNISATHMALSSTRVMATCALLGQAVGTACSIAKKYNVLPHGVENYITELKQALRDDDCYLLGTKRKLSKAIFDSKNNLSEENLKNLFSGIERKINDYDPIIQTALGEHLTFSFSLSKCKYIRLIFDNDIARISIKDNFNERQFPLICNQTYESNKAIIPPNLVKAYELYVKKNGEWICIKHEKNNIERLIKIEVNDDIEGIDIILLETYGDKKGRIYSIDCLNN